LRVGFPIRKSSDQSLLATPRSLSQRATSFIASWRQGIHQMPFLRLISTLSVSSPHRKIWATIVSLPPCTPRRCTWRSARAQRPTPYEADLSRKFSNLIRTFISSLEAVRASRKQMSVIPSLPCQRSRNDEPVNTGPLNLPGCPGNSCFTNPITCS
jgi:hypothetical protein